jgi:3-methyl-2-oxobutanoate hydroxymethyltransferase
MNLVSVFSMQRLTVPDIVQMKKKEKIVMVATYDYLTATLVEEAGAEIILVGDSVANVMLGYESTLPVTMEEMLHHTKAVARAARRCLVVGDMPFLSYQASEAEAIRNAGRFLKEGGAQAVKLEGGREVAGKVRAIVEQGIPVMGHLGLTPQKVHQLGGYRVVGREEEVAERLLEGARELERAGIFSLVLECVPWRLAKRLTEELHVPTIGIGAGPHCDGQVLVLHDLVGLTPRLPKFVKKYANLREEVLRCLKEFREDVKEGRFPTLEQSYE